MLNISKTISRLMASASLLACLSNPVLAMESSKDDKDLGSLVVKRVDNAIGSLEIYDEVTTNPDILSHIFFSLNDHFSQAIIPSVSTFFHLNFQDKVNEKLKNFRIGFEQLNEQDQKFVITVFGNKANCTKHYHLPVLNFIQSLEKNRDNLNKVYNGLPENMPHPFVRTFMANAVEFRFANVLGFGFNDFVKKLAAFPPEKLDALWSTGASIFQNVAGCHIHEWDNGCLNHLSMLSVDQLKAFGRNPLISENMFTLHKYRKESVIALQAFSDTQLDALGYNPSIYKDIDSGHIAECLSALSTLSVAQIHALGRNSAIFENLKSEHLKECFSTFKALSVEQIDALGQNYPLIFSGVSYLPGFPTALALLPEEKLNVLLVNPWILKKIKRYPVDCLKVLETFKIEELQTLARNDVILQGIENTDASLLTLSTCTVDKIDGLGRNASILQFIKTQLKSNDIYTLPRVLSALSTCSIDHLDTLGSNGLTIFQSTEKENYNWEEYITVLAALSVEQLKTLAPHDWIFKEIEAYPSQHIKMLQGLSAEQLDALGRNPSILQIVKKELNSDDASYDFLSLLPALPNCSVKHLDIVGSNSSIILQGVEDHNLKEHIKAIAALSVKQLETLVTHGWIFGKIKADPVDCLKTLKRFSVEQLESLGHHSLILKDIECENDHLKTLLACSEDEIAIIGKNTHILIPALFESGGPRRNAVKELNRLLEEYFANKKS